jgi:hypothetical protein
VGAHILGTADACCAYAHHICMHIFLCVCTLRACLICIHPSASACASAQLPRSWSRCALARESGKQYSLLRGRVAAACSTHSTVGVIAGEQRHGHEPRAVVQVQVAFQSEDQVRLRVRGCYQRPSLHACNILPCATRHLVRKLCASVSYHAYAFKCVFCTCVPMHL